MSSESSKATARESLSNIGVCFVSAKSRMNEILNLEKNTTSLTVMGFPDLKKICNDMERVVSGVPETPKKSVRRFLQPDDKAEWTDQLVEDTVQQELSQCNKKWVKAILAVLKQQQIVEAAKSKSVVSLVAAVQDTLPVAKDEAVRLLAMLDEAERGTPFSCSMTDEHAKAELEFNQSLDTLVKVHSQIQRVDEREVKASDRLAKATEDLQDLSYDEEDEDHESDAWTQAVERQKNAQSFCDALTSQRKLLVLQLDKVFTDTPYTYEQCKGNVPSVPLPKACSTEGFINWRKLLVVWMADPRVTRKYGALIPALKLLVQSYSPANCSFGVPMDVTNIDGLVTTQGNKITSNL